MGIPVARVSQIESGDVSTQDALNGHISALGGTLKLITYFGDEQPKIAGPDDFDRCVSWRRPARGAPGARCLRSASWPTPSS